MAKKELRIGYDKIKNPATITEVNEKLFRDNGLDTRLHEVDSLIDDDSRKERVYKVRKVRYFDLGRGGKR